MAPLSLLLYILYHSLSSRRGGIVPFILCVENDFTEEEMRSMANPREQRGIYIP